MPVYEMVVDLEWSGASGSPGVNVWHYRFDTPSNPAAALPPQKIRDFYDTLKPSFPGTLRISWDGFSRDVSSAGGGGTMADDWVVGGTGGTSYAPPGLAIIVNMLPTRGTGRGQGRKFFGPLVAGTVNSATGNPNPDTREDFFEAAQDLLSPGAGDGSICVWSEDKRVARDVVAVSVPNKFGMIRSRRD